AGRFGAMTDLNGQTTEYSYDGRGRVTQIAYLADGSTQTFSYGQNGELEVKTDEDGVSRTYVYESTNGRLFQTIDAEDNYIQYSYDNQGNKTGQSYHRPGGETTSEKEWDYQHPVIKGRLFKEILPNGTYTEYDYGIDGNLASVTDPAGNIVSYTYDAYNRLSEVTEPGGGITRYDYDLHGNLASVTDAENHTTTYVYDDMGRVVTVDSPDSGLSRYVYDPAGNRIERTDANGIKTSFSYDELNRITAEMFPDASDNVSYLYDQGMYGAGKLAGITDASGATAFLFDGRGRMVEKTSTVFGADYVLSRVLTPAGRTAQLTYPSGRTVDFERNTCACAVDRVSTTFAAITKVLVSNITTRPFGAADAMSSGSGGVVENEHDPVGRLKTANPGAERERQYTYDARGNHTGIHTPSTPWLNEDFTYDALNRLESGTGPFGTFTYTYDKVGNRQSLTGYGIPEMYYYVPGTNKIDYIDKYTRTFYGYDAAGSVTSIGTKTFVYNQNNRLARVLDNGELLGEYIYNAMGQRVVKTVNGLDTVFLYGFDDKLIAESQSNGVFIAEYIHRGDNALAKVECPTNTVYYYLNDYLGQPKALVDDQEQAVWEANYLPFGQAVVNPNSSVQNNLRLL
ncbi:MAG: RHS domain-containing protein, partial [Desulfobacterales bacterium]|nr:RHS domain-containing protein [Desulfobacterales bacterium]